MTENLFAQVRRKLNITWDDEDTTARVTDIILSAIPKMKRKLGIADPNFDFSEPGEENSLFLNYCLYEYNHCANEFDVNYANNIAQTRQMHEVSYYKSQEVTPDEE